MLSRWPIRYKLLLGVSLLCLIVAVLSASSFRGIFLYRELARSISLRSAELPLATDWTQAVARLQFTNSYFKNQLKESKTPGSQSAFDPLWYRSVLRTDLMAARDCLRRYRAQIQQSELADPLAGDKRDEWETLQKIERTLGRIDDELNCEDWALIEAPVKGLSDELETLNQLAVELPGHLQKRMHVFRDQVRGEYRAWIALTTVITILAGLFLFLFVQLFQFWVFRPLGILVRGSRRVAAGEFKHRIQLKSLDEMAELARAMNSMTEGFLHIRDDLDEQVKQRTKEVVRSEQLASVGYLAAGVAHEINNPLASIAWAAESLESRLYDILHPGSDELDGEADEDPEVVVLRNYLRKIQDEAFRCKGITEKLLDFSRMGDAERQPTDLRELSTDVIEMVRHLGKYRNKQINFESRETVIASTNPQETKQVVLNLITNALDSIDPGGSVTVRLERARDSAVLEVSDNGCGMTAEVLEHVFEPFYTRRRNGQGTGLGLSITYRIVADHGGRIEAFSDGPGLGSRFRLTLPLTESHEELKKQNQAA